MGVKPEDWTKATKIVVAGTVLLTIGGIADSINGFRLLSVIQPFATQAWVTQEILARTDTINRNLTQLTQSLTENSIQLIEGQLQARRAELLQIELRLEQDPDDIIARQRHDELTALVMELEARHARLICDLERMQGLDRSC